MLVTGDVCAVVKAGVRHTGEESVAAAWSTGIACVRSVLFSPDVGPRPSLSVPLAFASVRGALLAEVLGSVSRGPSSSPHADMSIAWLSMTAAENGNKSPTGLSIHVSDTSNSTKRGSCRMPISPLERWGVWEIESFHREG